MEDTWSKVEQMVLQSNPLLEAFGNAKTIRNDNSSRFGKYCLIVFDSQDRICGSTTENYLLEKVRVVSAAQDERNFHIFYQLVVGADSSVRRKFELEGDPARYTILSRGGCTKVPSIDDKRDFNEVMAAFRALHFSSDEIDGLFAIVSGVLALGNVTFRNGRASDSSEASQ